MAIANSTAKSLALLGALASAAAIALFQLLPSYAAAPLTAIVWTAASHRWPLVSLASLVARWVLLLVFPSGALFALAVSQIVPRAAMVVLAFVSRPSLAGPDTALASNLTFLHAALAATLGIAAALTIGWRSGMAILASCLLICRVAQLLSYQRLQGVDANSLELARLAIELWILWLPAALPH